MNKSSFANGLDFSGERPRTELMLRSAFSNEVRITLPMGSAIKEHRSKTPIMVHVLSGKVLFSVDDVPHELTSGDVLALAANISHAIFGIEDSLIRLSISH